MARDIFDEFEAEYKERGKGLSFWEKKDPVNDKKDKLGQFLDVTRAQSSRIKHQIAKKWKLSLGDKIPLIKGKKDSLNDTSKGQTIERSKYPPREEGGAFRRKDTNTSGFDGKVFDGEGNPTKEFLDYAVEDVKRKLGME